MTVNEYLAAEHARYMETHTDEFGRFRNAKHIQCADGLKLSVQASEYHYCEPRESFGPWSHVEVGFPSRIVADLLPYAEEPKRPTKTVYGWVPVDVVDAVIAAHGGMV